jgi:acyl carrier protein
MSVPAEIEPTIETDVRAAVRAGIAGKLGREPEQIDETAAFTALGLDSVQLLELSGELTERFDVVLEDYATYEFPTPAKLARHVAAQVAARTAGATR